MNRVPTLAFGLTLATLTAGQPMPTRSQTFLRKRLRTPFQR